MTAESAVLAGRVAAESLMLDTCTITAAGAPVWSEASGTFTPGTPTTIYAGKCKLQTRAVIVTDVNAGNREVGVVREEIHLPVVGSEAVTRGHLVTMIASTLDTAVVDLTFTVSGPHVGSMKTARRLPIEAVI